MSERKNIERLFQEKFKDFEAVPAPQAWENIASKLEKKENKRRVIPFWLKASGIAASLVLGYFAIDAYTNNEHSNSIENNSEKVVSSESPEKELLQKGNQQNTSIKEHQKNGSIVTTNNAISTNENQNDAVVANKDNNVSVQNSKSNQTKLNEIVVANKKENNNSVNQPFQSNIKNQVAAHANSYKKSNSTKSLLSNDGKGSEISPSYNETQSQSVAQNNPTVNHKPSLNNEGLNKENTSLENSNKEAQSQSVAQNNETVNHKPPLNNEDLNKENTSFENSSKEAQSQSVAQNTNASDAKSAVNLTENTNLIDNSSDITNQKSSIANATNQSVNPLAVIAKDSVAVAVEENPLEKIQKEKELQKKEGKVLVESTPKWKIKPNVAPLYMNSSKGSPIDAQFADNSKKFENKMSIGLGVDYALSSKVSLRTGINQFDLGYNTNDIAFYADLNSKGAIKQNAIKTINLRPDAQSMVIEDRKSTSSQELAIQNKETGYINQRMGYVEVPVEVSYKLLDKKFGIQFITGVSTLFLNDNQISVVSSGLTTVLGEANNLNKVHFSTNIGLGFKYSFWKSFEANFEPTFKYQINTFNDNSGGFKPYLIGLYSGLSFKF